MGLMPVDRLSGISVKCPKIELVAFFTAIETTWLECWQYVVDLLLFVS